MMKNREKPPSYKKSRRRRIKKPKFVSLIQLSHEKHPQQQPPFETITEKHHLQLNLFPLHPDHDHDHQNMAHLFSAADGGATSITSLLGTADTDKNINTSLSSSVSPATNYPCGATFSCFSPSLENVRTDPITLVRTALRNYRGTEESEERWVSFSEVVEKRSYEEVSSVDDYQKQRRNNINDNSINNSSANKLNSLALKLDYNEIMDAWSDRGPFYIHGESSLQIVPHHILLPNHDTTSNGLQDESEANDTWRVPEMGVIENVSNDNSNSVTRDKVVEVGEEYYWKIEGQRQESIRRYKEKRQNRLFAKRIRYQVRKLNAEKRPRVKGRFVKRG